MIPFAVVMVPQFIIWRYLNWLDTLWPLMIPHWFGSAWNIFLLRQFFMTIPQEYDEAAYLDGASRWHGSYCLFPSRLWRQLPSLLSFSSGMTSWVR